MQIQEHRFVRLAESWADTAGARALCLIGNSWLLSKSQMRIVLTMMASHAVQGNYLVKFKIDDVYWQLAPDWPTNDSPDGNTNNVLVVA